MIKLRVFAKKAPEAERLANQIEATTPWQSPEDLKQELVTRLYNLVNAVKTGQGIAFYLSDADETLKKVIQ